MSGGGFYDILRLCLFFAAVWLAGRFMKKIQFSSLLGEIIVGVALGPHCLDFVPYSKPSIPVLGHDDTGHGGVHGNHHPHELPSILDLVGKIGVIMMIMESGLHIDIAVLKKVGARACGVAILGTLLPLGCGMAMMLGLGETPLAGFAAGTALAPTSVGIALNLLTEQKQLDSIFGQTIVTAAFVDDVLSLLALVILLAMNSGSLTAQKILVPIIGSVIFVAGGILSAVKVFPQAMHAVRSRVKPNPVASLGPRDEVIIIGMFTTLIVFAWFAEQFASHLLGAFVAGIAFSKVPRAMGVWKRQVKKIVNWLVRLFFCASVAFAIPFNSMLDARAFGLGLLLTVIAIVTKVVAGVVLAEDRLLVGSAMVARGEFAYLVAQTCYGLGMLSEDAFSIVIWALVLATVVAPFGFKHVLMKKLSKKVLSEYTAFQIKISGHHHSGVLREVCQFLHDESYDVLQARMETDGEVDVETFFVRPRGGTKVDTAPATLKHFKHHLLEALDDEDAQVDIIPIKKEELDKLEGKVPEVASEAASSGILIKLMVEKQDDIFGKVSRKIEELGLCIKTLSIEDAGDEHHKMDVDEFYVEDKNGRKLDQVTREKIRDQLTCLFKENDVKGEIMVKFVPTVPDHFKQSTNLALTREVENLKGQTYCIAMTDQKVPLDKIISELQTQQGLDIISCKKYDKNGVVHIDLFVVDKTQYKHLESSSDNPKASEENSSSASLLTNDDSTDDSVHCGSLTQHVSGKSLHKRPASRFFVLGVKSLNYYSDKNLNDQKGSIPLASVVSITQESDKGVIENNIFYVKTLEKDHKFEAATAVDANKWIDLLHSARLMQDAEEKKKRRACAYASHPTFQANKCISPKLVRRHEVQRNTVCGYCTD